MKEVWKENAEKTGVTNSLFYLLEESAELIGAIATYKDDPSEKNLDNLVEETADVEICIKALKHLMHIETRTSTCKSSINSALAYLIQSICKYNRACGIGPATAKTKDAAMSNLIKQIGAVEYCIAKLKEQRNIFTEEWIERKTERTRRSFEAC